MTPRKRGGGKTTKKAAALKLIGQTSVFMEEEDDDDGDCSSAVGSDDSAFEEGDKTMTTTTGGYSRDPNGGAGGGSSSSATGSHRSVSSSRSSDDPIARNETKAVNRSKVLVYVALLLAAAGVGIATYFFIASQEQANFESDFHKYANELHHLADTNAQNIFGQLHRLSTTMTSFALSRRKQQQEWWPYITLRHFDLRALETEHLSGAEDIVFSPIVLPEQVEQWENYSWYRQGWIAEDLMYRGWNTNVNPGNISRQIYPFTTTHGEISRRRLDLSRRYPFYEEMLVPLWQMGPVPLNATIVNLDLFTHSSFHRMMVDVLEIEHTLLSEVVDLNFISSHHSRIDHDEDEDGHPRSFVLEPVFDDFESSKAVIIGFLTAILPWEIFFKDVLPEGINGLDVDVKDTCGSEFTYEIMGHNATYFGEGDLHDPKYDYLVDAFDFALEARYDDGSSSSDAGPLAYEQHCEYTLKVYPSDLFHDPYKTNNPWIYSLVVLCVFLVTILVFALYDLMVQRRQRKLMSTAKHTTKIVASLFPKSVQKRIMEDAALEQAALEQQANKNNSTFKVRPSLFANNRKELKDFLGETFHNDDGEFGDDNISVMHKTKPIADLFPATTIMFADLVGFTAWSSMRKPDQVFTLLETIYHHFDEIARRRRVFKVETVGDCYVAVAGLPEPRRDHATVMARFARDCLYKMNSVTKTLEVSLGPDTCDLGLRVGLHSGPVTAGVLRGERSRFQLFGDTMNTTSRIETTGASNRIHISSETANILKACGKGHWLQVRADKVTAKGKGELQTYWLELKGDTARSTHSGTSESFSLSDVDNEQQQHRRQVVRDHELALLKGSLTSSNVGGIAAASDAAARDKRLIDWNRDILVKLLKEIVARRESSGGRIEAEPIEVMEELEQSLLYREHTVLDEVKEVITLPKFNDARAGEKTADDIELDQVVVDQLRNYIQTIAAMYRENPFHNFQHVSHVSMSVVKLLSRIVAPEMEVEDDHHPGMSQILEEHTEALNEDSDDDEFHTLHDHTYGITSDPLTQFAVVFSAMIHDVDHPGVPNSQLVKEQTTVAVAYKNKSVAEQNSVDLAWDLLMDPSFDELRRTIYATKAEFLRFRQLVVNTVMATDIMDKDLGNLRKARWNRAFDPTTASSTSTLLQENKQISVNRKATIVIEHLIQASDVAHTMQHWHIYRKWNTRLFCELRRAWHEGRADKDPAENWYQGEIGFFDFYIIPLAKKLKECGVFGVSSDEYLNYAQQNRQEWESKGQSIVAEMLEAEKEQRPFTALGPAPPLLEQSPSLPQDEQAQSRIVDV